MIPVNSVQYMVHDCSKPVKWNHIRVWFQDNVGTTTGWREIPVYRLSEAEAFYWDNGDPMQFQEFDLTVRY